MLHKWLSWETCAKKTYMKNSTNFLWLSVLEMCLRLIFALLYFLQFCYLCLGIKVDRLPNSDPCRRYPRFVNTSQHLPGYNVITPIEVDVGLCFGICPFPASEGPTHRIALDRDRYWIQTFSFQNFNLLQKKISFFYILKDS